MTLCRIDIEPSLTFPVMLVLEGLYVLLARHLRSDHNDRNRPVTGGGIIFIIAVWLFALSEPSAIFPERFGYITGCATVLAIVSFIDDMRPLSPLLRLGIQIVTLTIPLIMVPDMTMSWIAYILLIFLGVAFVNAYNFMDGINGMTVAYSIVTLLAIGYCSKIVFPLPNVVTSLSMILFPTTAAIGFLNFRRHEIVHCGDAGSIVMGFLILYLISSLIYATDDWSYIALIFVYGVDTGYTALYRLLHGENILKGHKLHLYQLLDSRKHVPHLYISTTYAIVQAVIDIGLILTPSPYRAWYAAGSFVLLMALYSTVRYRISRTAI